MPMIDQVYLYFFSVVHEEVIILYTVFFYSTIPYC